MICEWHVYYKSKINISGIIWDFLYIKTVHPFGLLKVTSNIYSIVFSFSRIACHSFINVVDPTRTHTFPMILALYCCSFRRVLDNLSCFSYQAHCWLPFFVSSDRTRVCVDRECVRTTSLCAHLDEFHFIQSISVSVAQVFLPRLKKREREGEISRG